MLLIKCVPYALRAFHTRSHVHVGFCRNCIATLVTARTVPPWRRDEAELLQASSSDINVAYAGADVATPSFIRKSSVSRQVKHSRGISGTQDWQNKGGMQPQAAWGKCCSWLHISFGVTPIWSKRNYFLPTNLAHKTSEDSITRAEIPCFRRKALICAAPACGCILNLLQQHCFLAINLTYITAQGSTTRVEVTQALICADFLCFFTPLWWAWPIGMAGRPCET